MSGDGGNSGVEADIWSNKAGFFRTINVEVVVERIFRKSGKREFAALKSSGRAGNNDGRQVIL
ncbi:hypothetical protein OA90_22520 [Labrenzia sp. OB1]|nr:hypothetical protein OA90_22520 [Labrenzia sp. OB1]